MVLDPDLPVSSGDDDEYEVRETLVPRLVEAITTLPGDHGIAIALVGSWGVGKTSVLAMSEPLVNQESDGPQVVWFRPWGLVGEYAVAMSFFASLLAHLGRASGRWRELSDALKKVGKGVSVVMSGLSFAGLTLDPTRIGDAAKVLNGTGDLIDAVGESEADGAAGLRVAKELLSSLGENGQRMVIFVDDVDRLSADELFALLRLLRMITELPAVTAVVAIDEARVRETLARHSGSDFGRDYLDKVFQLKLRVPDPARSRLQQVLAARIKGVLSTLELDLPDDLTPAGFLVPDALELLGRLLRTPRDVVRFCNAYRVLMTGSVGRQLDATEAAILVALDVRLPEAYEALRNNRELLVGFEGWVNPVKRRSHFGADLDTLLSEVNQPSLRALFAEVILTLFGDLKQPVETRGSRRYTVRQTRSIRDRRHFDSYFLASHPKLVSPASTEQIGRWLVDGGELAPSAVEEFRSLTEGGMRQLLEDLPGGWIPETGNSTGDGVADRLVELARSPKGLGADEVLQALASYVMSRRPDFSDDGWRQFFTTVEEYLPFLSMGELLRVALSGPATPLPAWHEPVDRWLIQFRKRLPSGQEDADYLTLVEMISMARVLAAYSTDTTSEELRLEIGRWVNEAPYHLPAFLRSISVVSDTKAYLVGRVRGKGEFFERLDAHLGALDAADLITRWEKGIAGNDVDRLVTELKALLSA